MGLDTVFRVPVPDPAGNAVEHRISRAVLRLVKGGAERRAIESGQADAILDPASGSAYLLPRAQRWLMERTVGLQAQAQAQRPDPQARDVLDGLAAEVGVLDQAGVLLSTNQSWRNAAGAGACLGAGVAEGDNYLAVFDGARGTDRLDGLALAAGIRQVIAGERTRFRYEHTCHVEARPCWFTFNVTPAHGSLAARAVVSREEVTDRKHGELLLGLEYAVARTLAEATEAGAAVREVIRTVCETLHWECGRYFRLDPAAAVLRFHESWGVPTPAVGQFLEKSRGLVFHLGAGLKGRVYRSGQPLWVVAGAAEPGVSPAALAPESDSDGAFIFAITWENRTIGVLAFSGRAIQEPDDRMLHAARAIGSQLGRFLHRQQSLDTLQRNEMRFRRLTELSTDCYWEQDREYRFTEYAGAGVLLADQMLGKTLWELPNIVADSADWAAHRAQLGERWSFCEFEFTAMRADGQPGYYSISGEPVFDATGAFTGYWGTGLDITRRRRAEIALRDSEAKPPARDP